ncbi:hypothetical protein [Muninn virus]|nr:hypothetical protein [Muninn virus]
MIEIEYGEIIKDGKICSYCKYEGKLVEIFDFPYQPLIVLINGEKVKPSVGHVIIATKVAGWIETEKLAKQLKFK